MSILNQSFYKNKANYYSCKFKNINLSKNDKHMNVFYTYWENKPSQSNFPSHGYIWTHQPPTEKWGETSYYGNTSRWSIFCDSSSWEVQMDVCVVKKIKTSKSFKRGEKKDFNVEKLNTFFSLWIKPNTKMDVLCKMDPSKNING